MTSFPMNDYHQQLSQMISDRRGELAEAIMDRMFTLHPAMLDRYGKQGHIKCLEDTNYHLMFLSEALAARSPDLFSDYVQWVKTLLAGLNVPADDLVVNLNIIQEVVRSEAPQETRDILEDFLERSTAEISVPPPPLESHISDDDAFSELAHRYLKALLQGERHRASGMILEAVQAGTSVKDIYLHVFQRSQYEIGRLWQLNRITVAHEHYCTAATQMIMSQLYSHIFSTAKKGRWLVATSVAGELHEIGVRMVADFFEMDGWDTLFLGANTPLRSIVQAVIEHNADVLGISATMSFHTSRVVALISAVRASAECRHVKIIVGGYPFNIAGNLWQQVGADGYGRDAEEAIRIANHLTGADHDRL
jgi:MerR family transcriptional regulator, light-induced transcriptional regulator